MAAALARSKVALRLAPSHRTLSTAIRASHVVSPSFSRRSFATSNLQATSNPAPTSSSASLSASPASSKIETVPFHLSPVDALDRLDEAGASAFGVGAVFNLLWNRIMKRWGLGGGVAMKQVAMRALLLPVWRVDLAVKGKGLIGEAEMNLSVSTTDASLPGFQLAPLHNLTVRSPWDSEPETFKPEVHSKQLRDQGHEITVLPFTVGPLSLLNKIAALPRTNADRHGVGLDASSYKSTMFAAYPLYLPIYLGEYELNDQRATVVVFGASEQKAFAIYPSFIPSPTWLPPGDAIELSVGGSPVEFNPSQPSPSLKELKPRLDMLMSEVLEGSAEDPEYKTGKLMDALPEDWLQHERVMSYSEHAEPNREYMEAELANTTADAMIRQVEVLDENVRGVIMGRGGLKVAKRDDLLADAQKKLAQTKKALELARPEWIERIESEQKKRGQRGLVR
ncbi:hypothetical protein BCR35DRAFT_332309 [Leucosporidium creatinivorum]|uniref:Uncharacterized protein n=1 Tax=Leucosporidium creatinivorum TaxID=106004 RepID=A0A1Y2F3I8_9BASI|nr:hypothetical protein BCR35DRAFT_332309 [Leucosporidium creatinivorum]